MKAIYSGESHGVGMSCIIEGLPAGFDPDLKLLEQTLSIRTNGYGRSARMKIEADQIRITGGIVNGLTYGAPLSFFIENKDNREGQVRKKLTVPRPGHSDYAASIKYSLSDLSLPSEHSGGRLTACIVGAGEIARQLLVCFGIELCAFTESIGIEDISSLPCGEVKDIRKAADDSLFRLPFSGKEENFKKIIDLASGKGDSLGGTIVGMAQNIPPGLGDPYIPLKRLDSLLAAYIMAIPGIKGFEIGKGFSCASLYGSQMHDPFKIDKKISRTSNNSGGIEGGVSNGERIIIKAAMKPIPTLLSGMDSVNVVLHKPAKTEYVRSDVCAVPAAALTIQSTMALVLADVFFEKFGADSLQETRRNFKNYMKAL